MLPVRDRRMLLLGFVASLTKLQTIHESFRINYSETSQKALITQSQPMTVDLIGARGILNLGDAMRSLWLLILVTILVVSSIGFLTVLPRQRQDRTGGLSLRWSRTGGFAGVREFFAVNPDGSWNFSQLSPQKHDRNGTLTQDELDKLENSLRETGLMSLGKTAYDAKPGAFDFFNYKLELTMDGQTRVFRWVDAWASVERLPDALVKAQAIIESFISHLPILYS